MQMQFYPSGQVVISWGALSSLGASGIGYLVGFSPSGASTDPGSVNLLGSLPYVHAPLTPMALSAAPAPVSTVSTGTNVTYTQSNIPAAGPGVYIGLTIISVGQDLAGTDLGFLGMPGCNLHVTSLDVTSAFVGASDTLTTSFFVPPGAPYGFQLYAQAAAPFPPASLPNGQNPFGATLSNGVASFISPF